MEIVLKKDDIEKILKQKYRNIKNIKFSGKNPKITLEVDGFEQPETTQILTKQPVENKSVTPNTTKAVTVETPTRKPPIKNVMGTERRIMEL